MNESCWYKIIWSTEHSSGEFSTIYLSFDLALEASCKWHADMVSIDENPEEAAHEYRWEIVRIHPPIPEQETHHVH